jgi:hypothetical protein
MPDHMFSVWIAQAATTGDAEAIATAAIPKSGSDIALLGIASGTVCSVLVARSVVKGIPLLEDMNSIERFRLALNAASTPD